MIKKIIDTLTRQCTTSNFVQAEKYQFLLCPKRNLIFVSRKKHFRIRGGKHSRPRT